MRARRQVHQPLEQQLERFRAGMGQVGLADRKRLEGGGEEPRPLFVLVLFLLLSLGLTWPLVARAGNALLGTDSNALNDTYFSIWVFGWQARQLILDPLHLYAGNIFYPFPNTLAFSEIILPEALFYLPLGYATGNPVLAYNLVV